MNKINKLFSERGDRKLLSLYFCAGCPTLEGTASVIKAMQAHGIDMIEVGIPFSDPLADGPVIQSAGTVALKNGMTLSHLFNQLQSIKNEVHIPLVLMGYLNVIMHFGIEAFCQRCVEVGVSGAIIPDLPFADYLEVVKPVADRYDLRIIMMITPETSEERIRFIDEHTDGFIYMVSSASITGPQTKPFTALLMATNCSIPFSFLEITFLKTIDEILSYLREYQIGRPLSTGQVSFFVVRAWQIIHSA